MDEHTERQAHEILAQIGSNTLMCVGARDIIVTEPDDCRLAIHFAATITQNVTHRIEVRLEGNDTYSLKLMRYKPTTMQHITELSATDIYCDMMAEVVYRMCSPKFQTEQWFNCYGIKVEAAGRKYLRRAVA